MTTRIEMLDRALLRIGADPLRSETAPGAPVHLAVFDSVLDYLAGVHPWSFFRQTRRLVRLEAPPAQHYPYAFQLPPDRIGAIRAMYNSPDVRQPFTNYHLSGAVALTDVPALWCTFMSIATPAYWPGDFREGFTLLLMSELALSVRESPADRERLRRDALGTPQEQPHGGVIGSAIMNDSQAEPSSVIASGDNPLIDARF